MPVVGLITEYNPFHNGHLYHLNEAKRISGSETSFCVMSGNFLQRGEPALFNKWVRTEMALKSGVDLVVELPVAYAVRGAASFAFGGISILSCSGIVSHLCFGSEEGKIDCLHQTAIPENNEPAELKKVIKRYLGSGMMLPAAKEKAWAEYFNQSGLIDHNNLNETLSLPNNVLGIEYLKSLKKIGSNIKPFTIKRIKAQHHDQLIGQQDSIASASSVRNLLFSQGTGNAVFEKLSQVLPLPTLAIMQEQIAKQNGPVNKDNLFPFIQYDLRKKPPEELAEFIDVVEGLENRIKQAAAKSETYQQLIENIKTRRYSWTRIQRILLGIFLNYKQADALQYDHGGGPQYIRILGFSEKGKVLIKEMKSKATLPVITRPAEYVKKNTLLSKMLKMDIMATDIYNLLLPRTIPERSAQDLVTHPLHFTSKSSQLSKP